MNDVGNNNGLYDVTIVCTTDDHQANFWMRKLSQGVCKNREGSDSNESKFPMVLAVSEDWSDGGAGNGLGTLYAFEKAARLAKEQTKDDTLDLNAMLINNEISVALYHTAGKGTRLAPLPASENNNKPGVKLPFCHQVKEGVYEPLTILEAVVKQTGIYASSRKGRLSVYWGDQVFVPSASFQYTPKHHIDILCTLLGDTAPTEQEWNDQGLDKYGVIAVMNNDAGDDSKPSEAAQVEKVSHKTATEMLGKLGGSIGGVGPSLGSFSVGGTFLQILCTEFRAELEAKTGKLDTDPHFWMPLTLSKDDYVTLMKQKSVEEDISTVHYDRIAKMKESNAAIISENNMGLFGAVNVGKEAAWWDYGQLKLYSKNTAGVLLQDNAESELLKTFLGISGTGTKVIDSKVSEAVTVDDTSYVFSSAIKSSGTISKSLISSCCANEMEIGEGSIVVNCSTTKKIKTGKNCILYNITSENEDIIATEDGTVVVNVTSAGDATTDNESVLLKSNIDICGGKSWKRKLDCNSMSFEEVHKKNKMADITKIGEIRSQLSKKAKEALGFF